jgi:hypothetical protein
VLANSGSHQSSLDETVIEQILAFIIIIIVVIAPIPLPPPLAHPHFLIIAYVFLISKV